jgi:uncharacterized protein YecE (DUF72 family)/N-acetylglutamate synthase-like GNAT family acetyltransferase
MSMMIELEGVHLGACSWKYPSWRGLVYSDKPGNYLQEYARRYDCVEIDQWFYSLFKDEVVLPGPGIVAEYAASVPPGFRFGVKLPNALTLTRSPENLEDSVHGDRQANPHFLSLDLLRDVLDRLEPLKPYLGPLMFQFGYLNAGMMPSQKAFMDQLGKFSGQLPAGYDWCIETRNPQYLNADYFKFLRDHNLGHVWQQGYFMPSVFELYPRFSDLMSDSVVIRLHGEDREGIEERSGKKWSQLAEARDAELDLLAGMLKDLQARKRRSWVFANNHYEGCAPLTIDRIKSRLGAGKPCDPSLRCRAILHGSADYAATVELRNEVLRKPLGLLFSADQLQDESKDHHLACFKDGRLAACLVLTPLSESLARMRQVAVAPDCQRQGIGRALVMYAEGYAVEHGFREIMAHSRLSAFPFYAKLGYTRVGAPFTEVGIPHIEVRKRLG